jgi:hypothetical protein
MFSQNFAQIARFTTFKCIVSAIIVAVMLVLALIVAKFSVKLWHFYIFLLKV